MNTNTLDEVHRNRSNFVNKIERAENTSEQYAEKIIWFIYFFTFRSKVYVFVVRRQMLTA